MEELAQQKLINIEALKAKQTELEKQKEAKLTLKNEIAARLENIKSLKAKQQQVASTKKENALLILQNKLKDKQISEAEYLAEKTKAETEYKTELGQIEAEHKETINQLTAQQEVLDKEIDAITTSITANTVEQTQASSTMLSILGGFIPVIGTIVSLISL